MSISLNLHGRKPYCVYYANEWFHDGTCMASIAVVKYNTCTGERTYWYRKGHYPSEPFFIPEGDGSLEQEEHGALIFSVLNGNTGKSYIEVLDARAIAATDSKPFVEQEVPTVLPFTTHGEFFPGMIHNEY